MLVFEDDILLGACACEGKRKSPPKPGASWFASLRSFGMDGDEW